MRYTLKVKKLDGSICKMISESSGTEPAAVLRLLAMCYRETNRSTRKNEKIIKAKMWPAMDAKGDEIQRFRFELLYSDGNHYLYIYEFEGCRLD